MSDPSAPSAEGRRRDCRGIVVDLLAYVADVAILLTYFLMVRGRPARWFHWANAVGCVPIIATEVIASAWPPLVLTAAFGIIGIIGLVG